MAQNTNSSVLLEGDYYSSESMYIANIKRFLKETMQLDILDVSYYSNMYNWLAWYKGKVKSFHSYEHFNGIGVKKCERYSLGLPKKICERWASLLFNDKVAFNLDENDDKESNEFDQDMLNKVLEANNFEVSFADLIEMYFALGTGAITEFRDGNGGVRMNFVYGPMIAPLRMEGREIVDCAFGSVNGDEYYVQIHRKLKNGSYLIENKYFTVSNKDGKHLREEQKRGIKERYTSPVKLFQIFKPRIMNNINIFSPFGISIFGNALDEIKTADLAYDSLRNEFLLGKKKIFLRPGALTYKVVVDADGTTHNMPIFDENETEFFALPDTGEMGDGAGAKLIEESNPELRVQQHTDGMQTALNCVGQSVGFGLDYFTFRGQSVYTNETQVISTKSDLYSNLKNHEKVLDRSLKEMIRAIMFLRTGKVYGKEISIDFDDSIIEDSAEIQRQAMLELNNHLIDNVQYYQDVYKMTKSQAIEFDREIRNRQAQNEPNEPLADEDGYERVNTRPNTNNEKASLKQSVAKPPKTTKIKITG